MTETRFSIGFDELSKLLSNVNSVNSESGLRDIDKVVIFDIKKEGKSIAFARNNSMYIKIYFTPLEVETEGLLQVNSSELTKIKDNFSSLHRTVVKSIDFIAHSNRTQVIVNEDGISEEYEDFGGKTSYGIDTLNIPKTRLEDLHSTFDESKVSEVISEDLLLVLSTMLPTMDSKTISSNSMLYFSKEQIYVADGRSQIFFKNILPDVLHKNCFQYNTVSYLIGLIKDSSLLYMGVMPNKYFGLRTETADIEVFIKNVGATTRNEQILDTIANAKGKDGMGIVVDRVFLKDIIRRIFTSGKSDPTFAVVDGGFKVTTDNFERIIPIIRSKGDVSTVSFKMHPGLLRSMILGEDSMMDDNLYIYFSKAENQRAYKIVVSDKTNSFNSIATASAR